MFSNLAALAVAALVASAHALQNESTTYRYNINPDSVDQTFKDNACIGQTNVCNTVCYNGVKDIYCNTTTLVWNCECAGSPTPDLTKFDGTVPFFECQEFVANCTSTYAGDGGNKTAQQKCLMINCGGMNATKYAASATGSPPKPTKSTGGGSSRGGSSGSGGSSQGDGSSQGGSSSQGSSSGSGGSSGGGSSGGGSSSASVLGFGESYGLVTLVATALFMFGIGIGL